MLHYQWFADFGNVDAARAVAHMLTHGALRDYEQAIYYLRWEAGEARRPPISTLSASASPYRSGMQSDLQAHRSWQPDAPLRVCNLRPPSAVVGSPCRQAAGAGDADAMAHLGHIYANGIMVDQSNETALAWFWKAAEKGEEVADWAC